MNTALIARIAQADQIAATVRDARCCDALSPCGTCISGRREVQATRHAARIEALTTTPEVRTGLRARLVAALR